MQIVKALRCAAGWNRVEEKPRLLEEQFDGPDLLELEQMLDGGDACLEVVVGIHPFSHKLVTKAGAWWLVIVREAE